MFDRIARRYDLVNTVLSAGADAGWRLRAAHATELKLGGSALDVACGSGKLTEQLARIAGPDGRVVGLDFSTQMLEVARHGHPALKFWEGDALNLPFEDASFDASTIAFGLRNLADPVRGLRELLRVVKPGGRAVVLEFVRPPRGPFGVAYHVYLRTVLPAIGAALTGQLAAYNYLSQSIESYRSADELRALAEVAGWKGVRYVRLGAGTVGLLSGGSVDR